MSYPAWGGKLDDYIIIIYFDDYIITSLFPVKKKIEIAGLLIYELALLPKIKL